MTKDLGCLSMLEIIGRDFVLVGNPNEVLPVAPDSFNQDRGQMADPGEFAE